MKENNNFLKNSTIPTLTEQQRDECEGSITEEECLSALKGMKNGSSPGSNGLTIEFYKVFWNQLKSFLLKSFSAAFYSGSMSQVQRKAIITLIHKGKDLSRNEMKNWRPISLTNTDYKLLAKCLSLRLNCVIHSIIAEDQFGYMKGRQVSTLLRLIDDITDYLNQNDSPGLLVTIDYFHAFDCISKEYMLETFNCFGFGEEFVKWVSVLMSNTVSCINYCGWLSEQFATDSGIRQGCPFSPFAFILAVELLAIRLRSCNHIKGIKIPNKIAGNDFIKLLIALYADDITF